MLLIKLIFALFALLVGSFLNALIYRIPLNINIAFPRSSCPHCKHVISWYENIPVMSYLFLRGKCSNCKNKISLEYPLVEFFTCVCGFLMAPDSLNPSDLTISFFHFSVFCAFLVHFIIDIKHQILPDSINIYLGVIFLFVSVFTFPFYHWGLGALIGLGFPYLVSYIFYKLKGQVGLGGGDIKLWAVLGIYLGPVGVIHNIFLSCFVGAIFGGGLLLFKIIKRETPIPFGPFIILAAAFQIFFEKSFSQLMRYIS